MKIAVFGGTGRTGQHLVDQALQKGYQVQMLARTPSRMTIKSDRLTVIKGDVLALDRVKETIEETDVVLSAMGPTSNKPEYVMTGGFDNIIAAMQEADIRRLIMATGAGVRDPQDKPGFIDKLASLALNVFAKHVAQDSRQAVAKVRATDLDWTIVRVPRLTDNPAKGSLKVGYVGDITPQLTRADMAMFMLNQIEDDTWIGKAPAVSN